MENQVFTRLREYQVVVCKRCEHAVRPAEILSHLKGPRHRIAYRTAIQIAHAVRQWDGVAANPDEEVTVPTRAQRPITGLKEPQSGWLCVRDPAQCRYISTSIKTMKNHWKQAHKWVAFGRGGRPRGPYAAYGEREIQQSMA